jgi:hypothetical protein
MEPLRVERGHDFEGLDMTVPHETDFILSGSGDPMKAEGVSMNWGRGFFRVWVVVSVLWIGGVGVVEGPAFLHEVFPSPPQFKLASEEQYKLPSERDAVESVGVIPFVLHVVSLPLALLVAGLTVGWVGRGFRAKGP